MNDKEEIAYIAGSKMAWQRIAQQAFRELGESPQRDERALLLERAEAIARLRDLCGEFGDNDWSDDLHLADVIEKHLGRHLRD